MMIAQTPSLTITWEKLPDDYILPNDPVDNRTQPALAAALTESLAINHRLPETALTTTNYGICATVNGKMVVKAPDWSLIPAVRVPKEEVERSYTPRLQGDDLIIVMEFLSETLGTEYSIKPSYPPGKWFFYERVLQIPNYVIFEPEDGVLEFYRFNPSGLYTAQSPNQQQQYWIPEMQLFLGVWQGTRQDRTGNWLRWWDEAGTLLLWGSELAEQERQRTEQERQRTDQERQRTEQEHQRAERLAARLRELGEDPDLL